MFYDKNVVNIRKAVTTAPVEQEIDINDLFFRKIILLLKEGDKVLDIGTGNGFVLKQIQKKSSLKLNLYGLDNSEEMVNEAKKELLGIAEIIKGNNDSLPFKDSSFNMITAKNVTRFNAFEIYRVLKPGGFFVYREYGKGKGLVEVANLFSGRIIRSRDPSFYIEKLREAKMSKIKLDTYSVKKKFRCIEDLLNVTKSYPFISDYTTNDENIILKNFADNNIIITSDPFILVTQKL